MLGKLLLQRVLLPAFLICLPVSTCPISQSTTSYILFWSLILTLSLKHTPTCHQHFAYLLLLQGKQLAQDTSSVHLLYRHCTINSISFYSQKFPGLEIYSHLLCTVACFVAFPSPLCFTYFHTALHSTHHDCRIYNIFKVRDIVM